jgi:hypothetical protein
MTPDEAVLSMLMKAGIGGGQGGGMGQMAIPNQSQNPATLEQNQAGLSRNMGESQVGQQLAGTGTVGG